MRKITLLFLMLFVCSLGYSQYTIDDTDTTPFEDISATGTAMGLSDDGEGNAVIPFAFDFDGTVSSDVRIGNNGALLFGVTTGDVFAGNAVLAGQTPRIAPFWDDLDTESGDVYYETRGTAPNQRFIVQWEDRPHFSGASNPDAGTFQLVMYEGSNEIVFVYEDVDFTGTAFDGGASATIGIVTSNADYQYSFNTASVADGDAIRFAPPAGDPPVISCPMSVVVNNDAGECGAIVNFADAIAIDPEDGVIPTTQTMGDPSGSLFPVGVSTIEYSATDSDGNTSTCQFTITVIDNELPTITCQDITVSLDASGNIVVDPADLAASSSDNCGVTFSYGGATTTTESLETTFAGGNGNFGNMFDINALNEVTINSFDINADAGATFDVEVYAKVGTWVGSQTTAGDWTLIGTAVGVVSNGDGVATPLNLALGYVIPAGETHAFYVTPTDFSTGGFNYTNGTATGAVFASDANIEFLEGAGQQYPFTGSNFQPRVFNGNIIYDVTTSGTAGTYDCSSVGSHPVTIIATDPSGNTAECSAVITVVDDTAPEIVCIGEPGSFSILQDFEGATLPGGWTTEIVSGNFDWAFGSGVMPGGDDFPTNAAIFDDDAAGSGELDNTVRLLSPVYNITGATTAELSFDYSLQDFIGAGSFTVEVWDGATWQEVLFATEDTPPTPSGVIDITPFENADFQVRFTYDDDDDFAWGAGVDNVLIEYDIPSTPLDVVLDANGMATINVSDLLLSATDNCSFVISAQGGGAPVPQTLLTTLDGGNGNFGNMFDINALNDVTIDSFDIHGDTGAVFDVEVYAKSGTWVGSEDNPGDWTLIGTATGVVSNGDGAVTPLGLALDYQIPAGETHAFYVTPTDFSTGGFNYTNGTATGAVFASDANIEFLEGAGKGYPFSGTTFAPRVFNGNIQYSAGAGASTTTIDFDCEDVGENIIEVTAIDASGNESTCTATVNVIDNIDPVLVCMDLTVELGADGTATIAPEDLIDMTNSVEACGFAVTTIDIDTFDCDDIGTPVLVSVLVADPSNNTAICMATVTVIDALGPEVTCPADQTVDPGPGNLFYEVPDYFGTGLATATDNCTDPVTIFSQDPAAGELIPDGVYTVTLTATDEYGNDGTCTFELTVESVLGVDDNKLDNAIEMYPNPAQNQVTIANSSNILLERVMIYDLNGKLVNNTDLSGSLGEQVIDVSKLAAGVYVVQITGENATAVKRLIKE
tara:strand:+ start:150532 stop:154179 length:3648 start_codon:yes stop_codon:yes gene_type:complete